MYTLFYVKHEPDGSGTDASWSVYSAQYESIDAPEPIAGSTTLVSGNHPSPASANTKADSLQRASYALARQENSDASQD